MIVAVLLSFVIVLMAGGRFHNLKYAQVKGLMLPVAAFGIQAFLSLAAAKSLFAREPLFPMLLTVSYMCCLLF